MRGVYTAYAKITSLAAAKTLMLVTVPSSKVVEIYSASVSNATNETNEQLEIALYTVNVFGSAAGSSVTPAKSEAGDAAASVTVIANLTVEPTSYVSAPLDAEGANSLGGYRFDPIPETRPVAAPSSSFGLRLISTPTSFDAIVKIVFREIG
jgi:hypothetical protein